MMRDLGEHLGYLSKYAEGFIDHREVQDVCMVPHKPTSVFLIMIYRLCHELMATY